MRIALPLSLTLLALTACTAPGPVSISWKVRDRGTDAHGMTMTAVSLMVASDGETQEVTLGDYPGCGTQAIPADGPLLTLSCWWAGAGDDFQVRMTGTDTLTIDHRSVQEESDPPAFELLKQVTIPQGAIVVPQTEADETAQ